MKPIRSTSFLRNLYTGISILIIVFLFNSCAKNISFLTSSVVPAARGEVEYKKDKNENWIIKVSLTDLAESTRLQPSKLTYIVWMVANEEYAKNVGQLNSEKGFMSKQLKATLTTISPTKPTKVFITAEDDAGTQYPGPLIVLTTERF
jgi:hypothetical protein